MSSSLRRKSIITLCFLIGISISFIEKANSENITNLNFDTYEITLDGSELNNISALNVTLSTENLELSNSLNFKSNGASTLLSSLTNPSSGRYLISIVLNGKIKDGKAIISGKFLPNSVLTGALLNVIDISRDGGGNLNNSGLVTSKISFSNSQATAPTPSPSPTPSSSPTPSPTQQDNEDTSEEVSTKSEEVNEFVDAVIDNAENISIEDLTEEIENALEDESNSFKVTGSDEFLIRPKGINKYYVKVKGVLDTKVQNSLICYGSVKDKNFTELDERLNTQIAIKNPEHILFKEYFSFSFPNNGKKYRYDKRLTLTLVPNERGQAIYKGETSINGRYFIHCKSFNTEDPNLTDYLKRKGLNLKDINIFNIFSYEGESNENNKKHSISESMVRVILFKSKLAQPINVNK